MSGIMQSDSWINSHFEMAIALREESFDVDDLGGLYLAVQSYNKLGLLACLEDVEGCIADALQQRDDFEGLDCKDGSENDLVAVAANAVYEVYLKSTVANKSELQDRIIALIRELGEEDPNE